MCLTYVFVHFGVVEHGDELLKEALIGDLSVEGRAAAIHQDVEETERKKDHSQLSHLQAAKKLLLHHLSTAKQNTIKVD